MAIRSIRRRRRNRRGIEINDGNPATDESSRVSQNLPIHGKEEEKGKEKCARAKRKSMARAGTDGHANSHLAQSATTSPSTFLFPTHHSLVPNISPASIVSTTMTEVAELKKPSTAGAAPASALPAPANSASLVPDPKPPAAGGGVLLAGPFLRFPPPSPRQGGRRPRRWAGHGVLRQRGV